MYLRATLSSRSSTTSDSRRHARPIGQTSLGGNISCNIGALHGSDQIQLLCPLICTSNVYSFLSFVFKSQTIVSEFVTTKRSFPRQQMLDQRSLYSYIDTKYVGSEQFGFDSSYDRKQTNRLQLLRVPTNSPAQPVTSRHCILFGRFSAWQQSY